MDDGVLTEAELEVERMNQEKRATNPSKDETQDLASQHSPGKDQFSLVDLDNKS